MKTAAAARAMVPGVPRSHGVAGYVFSLLWRGRVVALLLGAGATLVGGSLILTYLTPETETRTFLDAAYLGIELLALVAPILASTLLTIQEFDQRTLWLILVRPVTRGGYARGRFSGLCLAAGAVVLAPATMVAVTAGWREPWLGAVACSALLETALVSALVCLVTAATTSWVTATLVECGLLLLGYAASLLPVLAAKPALVVLKPVLLAVYWLLPHLFRFAVRDLASPPEPWYLAALAAYAAVYAASVMWFASWIFSRREI